MDDRSKKQQNTKRWGALKSERSSWVNHWSEIAGYLLPRSGRFLVSDRNKGQKKHNNIYDSTATRALRVLGAGLMGGATSPARPWFRLGTPDPELMKFEPVKLWLNDVNVRMLYVFQRSNTYRALHSMYEEMGAFGTAASVFMDSYENVVHHYPLTIGEYALATDYTGRVNTLFREFDKTVSDLVAEFGYENCSARVRSMYDQGNYDKWVTVLHAIQPRYERDMNKKDAKNMAFSSCYHELGAGDDTILRESGMKSFRALTPRWAVTGGDVYGHGPGMEALGDIKQLQHEQLRKAECIDYQTKPPLQVPAGMKDRDLDRLPGGISFIDNMANGATVKTMFDVRLDLNHLLMDIQDVRNRVNETFYTNLFMMLANQSDARMTATEVAERHEEKLLMLGPVLERLHNELLDPMINLTFERMIEANLVPPPPEELQGQDLNVEFVSMLAQAQRAVATNGVDRFMLNLGQVAQFKPDVLDKIDTDAWADSYSDMLGVDPHLIVGSDKVALVRKARNEANAKMQQSAMLEQSANAANKLANAPTQGKNALTDVTQMFSGYSTPQGV